MIFERLNMHNNVVFHHRSMMNHLRYLSMILMNLNIVQSMFDTIDDDDGKRWNMMAVMMHHSMDNRVSILTVI